MSEVIISNLEKFKVLKENFITEGSKNVHIVSDFDRTVTYGAIKEGKRTPTIISQLRFNNSYLGEEYSKKAHRLYEIYRPLEMDSNLPLKEKINKMNEWWEKHFDLIAKAGLTKELIKKVVNERPLNFREGLNFFLDYLSKRDIPIIFISAAPGDMLVEYLKQNNLLHSNIHIISNLYNFDNNGKVIDVKKPIIHTFNKTEVTVKDYPIYSFIENRKNVILLGDSIGDVGMVKGFDYNNLIKIGFLNNNIEENLESYKEHFDVVLTGDQNFDYINRLIQEIIQ